MSVHSTGTGSAPDHWTRRANGVPHVLSAAVVLAFLLAPYAARAGAASQAANLVYNGGCEMPSPSGPPPGWAMWGAQAYKDPRNYTRDTANPHGGAASLRIHHPSGTGGYLVTAPDRAIRPTAGAMLSVEFWARAAHPGTCRFGFTAYSGVQPFVDAPSPGFHEIQVDTEWHRFAFTIREGFDCFADKSRYLLLTFDAARSPSEEQTLWVDDLVATQAPSDRRGRLVNAARLPHPPLEHRLRPGSRLEFTVDAARRVRRATRMAGGVSFHRVVGWTGQPYDRQGRYTLAPELETAIRDMRLPMTRFYGVGDEPFGLEGSLDRVAEVCRKVGVAQENAVLELETQDANRAIAPADWARAARYCRQKGYRFRYWEVGNEPYSSTFRARTPMGQAFPTPDAYVAHVRGVSDAVRRAQPGAQIGIGIAPDNQAWGNYVLRQAAGAYDFVVPHLYAGPDLYRTRFEDLVLRSNYRILDQALALNALIAAYNPGRKVYVLDTEWGMIGSGPNGEEADYAPRNANVIGAVHRAVRLIYYAREGMLRGASAWQMLSAVDGPGFGILSQQAPDKRFLLYWLHREFNGHAGEWVVALDGMAPWDASAGGPSTPVLATVSADGRQLYLVIANGSWDRPAPMTVHLRGFPHPSSAEAIVLTQPSLDSSPLLARQDDAVSPLHTTLTGDTLTADLPAHCVTFVTLRRK